MDLNELQNALKQFTGLDAALYGFVIPLALAIRFARAYWTWCDDAHTLAAGVALGIAGAVLHLTLTATAWQLIAMQSLSLSIAILIAERALRAMAGKLWLPRDNEYIKLPPSAAGKTEGGS